MANLHVRLNYLAQIETYKYSHDLFTPNQIFTTSNGILAYKNALSIFRIPPHPQPKKKLNKYKTW